MGFRSVCLVACAAVMAMLVGCEDPHKPTKAVITKVDTWAQDEANKAGLQVGKFVDVKKPEYFSYCVPVNGDLILFKPDDGTGDGHGTARRLERHSPVCQRTDSSYKEGIYVHNK